MIGVQFSQSTLKLTRAFANSKLFREWYSQWGYRRWEKRGR